MRLVGSPPLVPESSDPLVPESTEVPLDPEDEEEELLVSVLLLQAPASAPSTPITTKMFLKPTSVTDP